VVPPSGLVRTGDPNPCLDVAAGGLGRPRWLPTSGRERKPYAAKPVLTAFPPAPPYRGWERL